MSYDDEPPVDHCAQSVIVVRISPLLIGNTYLKVLRYRMPKV